MQMMHCCPSEAGGPSSATGWLLEGAFPNMPPVNKEDNRGGSLGGPELLGPGAGLLGPKAEPALNGCTEEAGAEPALNGCIEEAGAEPALNGCTEEAGAEPALNGCTEEAGAEDVLAFPLPAPKRKDAPGPPAGADGGASEAFLAPRESEKIQLIYCLS
eukprot:1157889-Pelagomonas_calceolata.AAC.2